MPLPGLKSTGLPLLRGLSAAQWDTRRSATSPVRHGVVQAVPSSSSSPSSSREKAAVRSVAAEDPRSLAASVCCPTGGEASPYVSVPAVPQGRRVDNGAQSGAGSGLWAQLPRLLVCGGRLSAR